MSELEGLLTIEDVAELFKIKKSRLYVAVQRKEIPHIKLGNLIRFDINVIKEWIKNNTKLQ